MPIEYAIFLVAAFYLVGGLVYVKWIHRPRKRHSAPDDDPAPKNKNRS